MQDVTTKPAIITLCGSSRHGAEFTYWQHKLSCEGKIVFQTQDRDSQITSGKIKAILDELHLRKIDLSDEVMVLDVEGYIGETTDREIAYAKRKGKRITYLSEIFRCI